MFQSILEHLLEFWVLAPLLKLKLCSCSRGWYWCSCTKFVIGASILHTVSLPLGGGVRRTFVLVVPLTTNCHHGDWWPVCSECMPAVYVKSGSNESHSSLLHQLRDFFPERPFLITSFYGEEFHMLKVSFSFLLQASTKLITT